MDGKKKKKEIVSRMVLAILKEHEGQKMTAKRIEDIIHDRIKNHDMWMSIVPSSRSIGWILKLASQKDRMIGRKAPYWWWGEKPLKEAYVRVKDGTEDIIMGILSEGPMKCAMISERTGMRKHTAYSRLGAMKDEGLVIHRSPWWYDRAHWERMKKKSERMFLLSDYKGTHKEKCTQILVEMLEREPDKEFTSRVLAGRLVDEVRYVHGNSGRLKVRNIPDARQVPTMLKKAQRKNKKLHYDGTSPGTWYWADEMKPPPHDYTEEIIEACMSAMKPGMEYIRVHLVRMARKRLPGVEINVQTISKSLGRAEGIGYRKGCPGTPSKWFLEEIGNGTIDRILKVLEDAGGPVTIESVLSEVEDSSLTTRRLRKLMENHDDVLETAADKWIHRNNAPDWWEIMSRT